jgi:hypothetical protein
MVTTKTALKSALKPTLVMRKWGRAGVILGLTLLTVACTQETQNQLGRAVRNWTGDNGVLEVYAGSKMVKRFIEIDKLSTARSTNGENLARPYRFGYGVLDANFNNIKDAGEKRVYFEFSDYSTQYVFFENPGN